jgi:hypothetical protein
MGAEISSCSTPCCAKEICHTRRYIFPLSPTYIYIQHTNSLPQAAIEADVSRLLPLLSWPPTFPTLNSARNFVQNHCYATCFSYTGWEDVEIYRFRLFVHFNTAKEAYKKGVFGVSVVPDARALGEGGRRGEEAGAKKEMERNGETVVAVVGEESKAFTVKVDGGMSTLTITDTLGSLDPSSSSSPAVPLIDIPPSDPFGALEERLSGSKERVEVLQHAPAAKEDPFKVCYFIVVLERVFVDV